jgi:hypothetical protein
MYPIITSLHFTANKHSKAITESASYKDTLEIKYKKNNVPTKQQAEYNYLDARLQSTACSAGSCASLVRACSDTSLTDCGASNADSILATRCSISMNST